MSFDINELVFDEQGTYQEEPALRYEHALMEQFAPHPKDKRSERWEPNWAGPGR